MSAVVFAGPSLSGHDWATETSLVRLHPAKAGDLYRAARDGAKVIGLIDGVFEQTPAVRHKEILWALSNGARVFGAASMGALRAAECARFGMHGVGAVFAGYASGDLKDDDEVALVHAPAELDYRPVTEALVNVRATLDEAVRAAVLDQDARDAVLGSARALFYKERTWPRILSGMHHARAEDRERLAAWLPANRVDLKREDALQLLDTLRGHLDDGLPEQTVRFRFRGGAHWERAREHFDACAHRLDASDERVLDELRLHPRRFGDLAAVALAQSGAAAGETAATQLPLEAFRIRRRLTGNREFQRWAAATGITPQDLSDWAHAQRAIETAVANRFHAIAPRLLTELKLRNEYAGLRARSEHKAKVLSARARTATAGDLHALLEWFCDLRGDEVQFDDAAHAVRALALAGPEEFARLLRDEEQYLRAAPQSGSGPAKEVR